MCQFNLDASQDAVNKKYGTKYDLPILYFTQMIGVALGIPEKELGIGKEIVSAKNALAKISTEPPPKPQRVRRAKEALPMPVLEEV
jgi:heterodisulfide reductase subunit B